jgi:hypothetical protein
MGPRRTYVVSLYDADNSIVVEAVQRDERARLDDLDGLAARIREWEDAPPLPRGGARGPGSQRARPGMPPEAGSMRSK